MELESSVLPPPEVTPPDGEEPKKRRGRPPGSKNKPKTDDLQKEVSEKLTEVIGVPVSFVSPIAAAVLEQRKEKTAKAIVALALQYPAFQAALNTFLQGTAIVDIGMTVIGMGIAFAVDHQQIEPNAMPAVIFGIDEIVVELYGVSEDEAQMNGGSQIARDRGLLGDINNA